MENPPTEPAQPHVSLDTAVGLSFDYLKQLGTISMTAAGGLIALVQFVDGDKGFFVKAMIAASALILSALCAFIAQVSLVNRIKQPHALLRKNQKGYDPEVGKKYEKTFESLAFWLLAISLGMAMATLFSVMPIK